MTKSNAYINFRSSLDLADALLVMERRFTDPPIAPSVSKVLGLRGGASVLCVAAFENFLRDLFIERFAVLTSQPPNIDFHKLPRTIRITSVWESLQQALKGPKGVKTDKIDRLPAVVAAAKGVGADVIAPAAFAETNANPGPETVKEMFRNAGISDVFGTVRAKFDARWPKPEATSFLNDKLAEIIDRRNVVAHTVDVRRITRNQLDESLEFLDALAQSLDELLAEHIDDLLITCAP